MWRWSDRAWALALGYAALHARTRLAHPAHLQRGREPRAVVRGRARVLGAAAPDGHRILVVDDSSPDGTGEIADRLAAEHPDAVEVLHRTASAGPRARPTSPASSARSRAAPATSSRWTPTSPTTRPTSRACSRPCATTAPTSRSARATSPGGGVTDWGASAAPGQPRRLAGTRGACSALEVRDLTGGFKCFRARGAARDRPAQRALARLRLPGRAHLPRAACAGFRVVEVPIVFRDRAAGQIEDVVADRRRGDLARAAACAGGAAHLRHPAAASSAARRADRRRVNVSELALVQGCATRAPRCGAGTARRWRVLGPWALGAAASRSRCSRPSGWSPTSSRPTRRGSCPGLNEPATSARSATSSSATRSCSRCTRWPASRASSPAARCRRRPSSTSGWLAQVHEHAGPLAIAFVAGATTFSLCTQAYVLGSERRDAGPAARHRPRALLLTASCPTRCPSSSRCSCRSRRG